MTKRYTGLVVFAFLVLALSFAAQEKKADPGPVTATVRGLLERNSMNLVAAAEAMPAEKYNFKPTVEQMTFAHLVVHAAEANHFFCSKIAGEAQTELKLNDNDPKEKLVESLRASFAYCGEALEKMEDSKLGDTVTLFGGQPRPRAAAVIGLTSNWADHYGMAAMYLRLNGLLPPTAQPKK